MERKLGWKTAFLIALAEGYQVRGSIFQQEYRDVSFCMRFSSKSIKFGCPPTCCILGLWARRHEDTKTQGRGGWNGCGVRGLHGYPPRFWPENQV
jgi:hypothetical protein